ncbi:hypothetical protein HDU92_001240 [Lobulomyces angularis]|nr:hypothetical protein HDU92_001240 [Lobulomyces angularis]
MTGGKKEKKATQAKVSDKVMKEIWTKFGSLITIKSPLFDAPICAAADPCERYQRNNATYLYSMNDTYNYV